MSEQPKHDFKPGDKILRTTTPFRNDPIKKGHIYTVDAVDMSQGGVRLKELMQKGYYYTPEYFELVESSSTLPCIKEIPPRPASREIQDGYLYQGSPLKIQKHDHKLHLDMPYWLYTPYGSTSMYFNKKTLKQLAEALTEIVKVIEEGEENVSSTKG